MHLLTAACLVAFTASQAYAGRWWGNGKDDKPECESKWTDWERTTKCVWPGVFTKADAPKACMALPPKPAKMPELPYKIMEQKYDDYFNQWQVQLKERGIPAKPCGMCGFKLKCRQLAEPPTQMHCPVKEKIFVNDPECQSDEPCTLTQEKGGCDAPEILDMMHFMSVMTAMSKPGAHMMDMKYGHQVESFMGMMMGAPKMGMMKMFGKGHHKRKGKKWGSSSSSSSSMSDSQGNSKSSSSSSEEGGENAVQKRLDDLVKTLSGKDKDEIITTLKTMMSRDGPAAERIRETLDAFKSLFNRRKRQADQPEADQLAEDESYLAPKVNCVPNKANDGCLCCCDWYVPDRDNNKCVNVKDAMITFIKDFNEDGM